jgi:hypothetical protein
MTDSAIACLDVVQAASSGTRAICATGDMVFTWRVDFGTGALSRLLVSRALRLLVPLSDASVQFYDYSAGQNSLELADRRS